MLGVNKRIQGCLNSWLKWTLNFPLFAWHTYFHIGMPIFTVKSQFTRETSNPYLYMKAGIWNGFLGIPILTWHQSCNSTIVDSVLRPFGLVLLLHIWKLLFTNLRGVVCLFYSWRCFCCVVVYTWFCSEIWLVPPDPGAASWQLSLRMLSHSLSSLFLRRETGNNWVLFSLITDLTSEYILYNYYISL